MSLISKFRQAAIALFYKVTLTATLGRVNEFVWESNTDTPWIETQLEHNGVDGIFATHTGIPWIRRVRRGFWCNAGGVLERPAHEGKLHVYFGQVDFPAQASHPTPHIVPLTYDPQPVVAAMAKAVLPQEFQASLLTGIWTTCAEILPKEEQQARSRLPTMQVS